MWNYFFTMGRRSKAPALDFHQTVLRVLLFQKLMCFRPADWLRLLTPVTSWNYCNSQKYRPNGGVLIHQSWVGVVVLPGLCISMAADFSLALTLCATPSAAFHRLHSSSSPRRLLPQCQQTMCKNSTSFHKFFIICIPASLALILALALVILMVIIYSCYQGDKVWKQN